MTSVVDMEGLGGGEGEALSGLLTASRRPGYVSKGRPESVSNDSNVQHKERKEDMAPPCGRHFLEG